MEKKRFYILEFTDEDRDQILKHLFITSEECKSLTDLMLSKGVQFRITDMTGLQNPLEFEITPNRLL